MEGVFVATRDFNTTTRRLRTGMEVLPGELEPPLDFDTLKARGWIARGDTKKADEARSAAPNREAELMAPSQESLHALWDDRRVAGVMADVSVPVFITDEEVYGLMVDRTDDYVQIQVPGAAPEMRFYRIESLAPATLEISGRYSASPEDLPPAKKKR